MVQILAPIKRPLSRKNTSPSQKDVFYFAEPDPVQKKILFVICSRAFKYFGTSPLLIRYQAPIRIKVIVFATPGPESGPQKNIGTLLCPKGCYKIKGSKRANHSGLMTRADHKKGHPPGVDGMKIEVFRKRRWLFNLKNGRCLGKALGQNDNNGYL